MRDSVRHAFHRFSEPLEGRVDFLYLDSAEPVGLVTTATGILVDPISAALDLPFLRPDGSRATRAEIAAEWERVKARQDLKRHGGMVFRHITSLRLAPEDIDALVERKLESNHTLMLRRFPDLDSWPADAQLAIHSWAWAVGTNSPYPRMSALLRAGDFEAAAEECTINPQRGTIVERNRRNRVLFRNAARVRDLRLDPDVLWYPRDLAVTEAPTLEELPNPPSEPVPTPRVDTPSVPSRRPPEVTDLVDWDIVHKSPYDEE